MKVLPRFTGPARAIESRGRGGKMLYTVVSDADDTVVQVTPEILAALFKPAGGARKSALRQAERVVGGPPASMLASASMLTSTDLRVPSMPVGNRQRSRLEAVVLLAFGPRLDGSFRENLSTKAIARRTNLAVNSIGPRIWYMRQAGLLVPDRQPTPGGHEKGAALYNLTERGRMAAVVAAQAV